MKAVTLVILLVFFVFRSSFTLLKGKRSVKKVTSFVYFGRKLIEVVIYFLIPALLLLEIIVPWINVPFYYLGIFLSIFGLMLMIWTRLNRNKDWGFMGDSSGNELFVDGPYKFTRHPYYVGAILVGVGIYLQLHFLLVVLMIPVIFFIMHVISKEDIFLEKEFSSKYVAYKSRVGIFPWFY